MARKKPSLRAKFREEQDEVSVEELLKYDPASLEFQLIVELGPMTATDLHNVQSRVNTDLTLSKAFDLVQGRLKSLLVQWKDMSLIITTNRRHMFNSSFHPNPKMRMLHPKKNVQHR